MSNWDIIWGDLNYDSFMNYFRLGLMDALRERLYQSLKETNAYSDSGWYETPFKGGYNLTDAYNIRRKLRRWDI